MSVVEIEKDANVAVIKMTNGEKRHNKVFEESMSSALDQVAGDESIAAAVLTSTDAKNWSQGIDLEWLMQQIDEKNTDIIREFLHGMDQVFRKLLVLPVPVIAAINGHAYANGAILATHCDFRFMRSDRGFFCLPEVNLDIQFTPAMHRLFYHKYPSFVVNRRRGYHSPRHVRHGQPHHRRQGPG
jgi:enoyl-CoA hydratase/carnithine racemase